MNAKENEPGNQQKKEATMIITCGTSLLESACWNIEGIRRYEGASDQREILFRAAENRGVLREYFTKHKSQDFKEFDPDAWRNTNRLRDLPAELASLRVFTHYLENQEKSTQLERIVLVHSDEGDGAFCGEALAKIIERIRGDSNLDPKLPKELVVQEWERKGLDATDARSFQEALSSLFQDCKKECDEVLKNKRDGISKEVILNLTAGYNAIAITLAQLLARIGAMRIIYLFEGANQDNLTILRRQDGKAILTTVEESSGGGVSMRTTEIDISEGGSVGAPD